MSAHLAEVLIDQSVGNKEKDPAGSFSKDRSRNVHKLNRTPMLCTPLKGLVAR